jgi:vacuolar-type H+-ATPase subunit E/Vma4
MSVHLTNHNLDRLSETLFEMLQKLRESARAMAEQEANMQERIKLLETQEA